MTSGGVEAAPRGTLVDRALRFLGDGPAASSTLAREVLGLAQASRAVAEQVMVALLAAHPRVRRLADGRWTLTVVPGRSPRLDAVTYAVVDVETTGSRAGVGDRITEIAIVTLDGGRVEAVLDTLVNPERPIAAAVTAVTRITPEMLRGQPRFAELADDVVAALAGRVFVGHNVRFDWRFVSTEIGRARDLALAGPRLCTRLLARRLIPGLRSRSLDSVAAYFGVEIHRRHRAGGDATATAEILRRLLELAREHGALTLDDLAALSRRRRRRRSALPTPMAEA